MTEPLQRVFLVGCPRSGSTWSTFLLAQHPQIATFQHAKLFDYLVWMERWYQIKAERCLVPRPGDAATPQAIEQTLPLTELLAEEDLYPLLAQVADGVLGRVASLRPGVTTVVDKTPENGHRADFILRLFPDAYFLHVIRDPRSVFSSHRSASNSWANWEFPTQPIDGARYWCQEVAASLRVESLTERYLAVRYEDLREDGPATLRRILEFLGLPAGDEFCTAAVAASTKDKMRKVKDLPSNFVRRTPQGGWKEELRAGDVRLIEHVAGQLMEQLGYARARKPYRLVPPSVWLQEGPEKVLDWVDRKLHRMTQLMYWKWKGRQMEWPFP